MTFCTAENICEMLCVKTAILIFASAGMHTHQLPQEILLVELSCVLLNEPQIEKFDSWKYSQLHVVLV